MSTKITSIKGEDNMVVSIAFLVLSLVFILIVCAVFTNAVEWFGKELNLSHGVTGSILAAVGTALSQAQFATLAVCRTYASE